MSNIFYKKFNMKAFLHSPSTNREFHKILFKSILPISLIICLISISACGKGNTVPPSTVDSITAENASISFNNFTNNILKNELNSNTLSLHYTAISPGAVGIENYDLSIGHYSLDSMRKAYSEIVEYQKQLSQIPYDSLSDENKLTYDIMDWYFSHQINPDEFAYFDEPLSKTIGIQSQLPLLFSEYKFRSPEDVDDYLNLLEMIPVYFEEIIQYENEKSSAGMFMADFTADRVIQSIDCFLNDKENHYLINSFNERIENLSSISPEDKTTYIETNKTIVNDQIFSCYQKLKDTLLALKSSGTNTGGLCNFPKGTCYYEKLLQNQIGTTKTTNELISAVDNQVNSDLNDLGEILTDNPSLIENLNDLKLQTTDATKILNNLSKKMSEDFPTAVNCNYNVKEISDSLQSSLSPAFYLSPPIDSANENTIYINPAYNTDSITLFSTLAHEGFPGHMYQNLYSASCQTNPVRSIFNFKGYSEGYATYAEIFSYKYLDFDETLNRILALSNSITLGIYARLDLAIHSENYTYNKAHDFLVKYGITDTETTTEIYQSVIEQPGNYMSYYGGYLEFLELKEKAQKKQKDNFSLKEFHNYILSVGDAPFEVLEKYLD